jgi:hypothetical protein
MTIPTVTSQVVSDLGRVYMITWFRRALLASVSYPSSGSANPTVTDHGGNLLANDLFSWPVCFTSTEKNSFCVFQIAHTA